MRNRLLLFSAIVLSVWFGLLRFGGDFSLINIRSNTLAQKASLESRTTTQLEVEEKLLKQEITDSQILIEEKTESQKLQNDQEIILEEKKKLLSRIILQWKSIQKEFSDYDKERNLYYKLNQKNPQLLSPAEQKTQRTLGITLKKKENRLKVRLGNIKKYYPKSNLELYLLTDRIITTQLNEIQLEVEKITKTDLPNLKKTITDTKNEVTEANKKISDNQKNLSTIEEIIRKRARGDYKNPVNVDGNGEVIPGGNGIGIGNGAINIGRVDQLIINFYGNGQGPINGNNILPQPDTKNCGNGKVDSTEACDDGNKVDNDGCSNSCTIIPLEIKCKTAGIGCQIIRATLTSLRDLDQLFETTVPFSITFSTPINELKNTNFTCRENNVIVPCIISKITPQGNTYTFFVTSKVGINHSIFLDEGKVGLNGFTNKATEELSWTVRSNTTSSPTGQRF